MSVPPAPPHRLASVITCLFLVLGILIVVFPLVSADSSLLPEAKPPKGASLPSSVIMPLYGDVYPSGLYYTALTVGGSTYFLDVDSGSDLTWLQCDAPCVRCTKGPHAWYKPTPSKLVKCPDPLCAAAQKGASSSSGRKVRKEKPHKCESAQQQCDYEVKYADQGSSLGVLMSDTFQFRLTNSSVVRPTLAFGCGYDQQPGGSQLPVISTDGVFGIGRGRASLLSQLKELGVTKDVTGHCLSSVCCGGFLFFGDEFVPYSRATWVPMAPAGSKNYHYSPGKTAILSYNSKPLGAKPMELVFDSGSSYTYFAANPYQAFVSALKSQLTGTPLKEAPEDKTLPLCWKGPRPFTSVNDAKNYFKSLALSFNPDKKATLEIPPEGYLIISAPGNACLGILNGSEIGMKDLSIIGDISMLDLLVVYDNEEQRIGWIRASCNKAPNMDTINGFYEGDFHPQYTSVDALTGLYPSYYYSSNAKKKN